MFQGEKLAIGKVFLYYPSWTSLKKRALHERGPKTSEAIQVERTEVDLPPSGVPKFTLLEVSSWSLPLKSLIWLRPQYDWSCCCFVIFVPQKSSEVVIFQEVVLDLFGVSLLVFWSTVFTRKPIVSGKPFPCPTPSGVNHQPLNFMRLAFALRRAFPVGVLAAGSLWQGVALCVAMIKGWLSGVRVIPPLIGNPYNYNG